MLQAIDLGELLPEVRGLAQFGGGKLPRLGGRMARADERRKLLAKVILKLGQHRPLAAPRRPHLPPPFVNRRFKIEHGLDSIIA
jgi:hypothetical protein